MSSNRVWLGLYTMSSNRVWLNGGEEGDLLAALAWRVDWTEDDPHRGGSAGITIRDCARQVDMDFDWHPTDAPEYGASLEERLTKLDLFIDELKKMHAEMLKAKRARKRRRHRRLGER